MIVCFQKGLSDGIHQELDELRRRNRSLQEQLRRGHVQAEKPYESNIPQEGSVWHSVSSGSLRGGLKIYMKPCLTGDLKITIYVKPMSGVISKSLCMKPMSEG